ncbi:MAG TPA: hypothetical protein PLF88_04245 [Opitutaceae bacterium]|nr:hypothetical protein [Opitutaceae bacterium]HRJ47458.1 hypothetical protein [Opitutaceae bacterium]
MKIAKLILLAALVAVTSGCQIATKKVGQLNTLLVELDRLGIEEAHIPGRVTSTKYVRDGDRSTLTHNNPQLSEPIKIVRRRPVEN